MKLDILCNTEYLIRGVLETYATRVLGNWAIALALPNSQQPQERIHPNHKKTNSNAY